MSREKSIKTINIHLEKLTALELEEVTVLTNALLAVRNVREEHQVKISGYTEEIQRLEYKAKEFQKSAELTAQEVHKLRDANKQLKSQLEKQQPDIPEVPPFVADWLDRKPLYTINGSIPVEVIEWSQKQTGYADIGMNINHLLKLKVNGYTVVKEKKYLLKHKSLVIYDGECEESDVDELYLNAEGNFTIYPYNAKIFTQSEIDSMNTASYELIEVSK